MKRRFEQITSINLNKSSFVSSKYNYLVARGYNSKDYLLHVYHSTVFFLSGSNMTLHRKHATLTQCWFNVGPTS